MRESPNPSQRCGVNNVFLARKNLLYNPWRDALSSHRTESISIVNDPRLRFSIQVFAAWQQKRPLAFERSQENENGTET